MRKVIVLAAVAGGLFALAGPAQAKEIVELKICGASGCVVSKDSDALRGWEMSGDPAQVYAASPASFYTVRIGFGDPEGNVFHTEIAYWLPRKNIMRYDTVQLSGDAWWRLFPPQAAMLHSIASGIEPFTPRLSRARVGGRPVTDPSSYLRLFGSFPYTGVPSHAKPVRITMTIAGPNAWASGKVWMDYYPHGHQLSREAGTVRIPKLLGQRLMHRASLAPGKHAARAERGGASRTSLYAGIGAAGVAAAGLFLVLARRKARNS